MPNTALVTAVIPTYNRPSLVVRAVKTALTQTHTNMEVVVVLDGPEDSTSKALGAIADPRIQIVTLPQHQGACGARNAGVQTAKGEWIAFLDDDDEWLPLKIELQLRAAQRSVHKTPVISCRIIARGPFAEYTLPKRFPDPGEPISEYLFHRKGVFSGEGGLGTPTLFARRDLLLKHPFRHGLRQYQDADWVIRVAREEGVGFQFEPTPLVVCAFEQSFPGITNSTDWRSVLSWIEDVRPCITAKAYASFILLNIAGLAAGKATTREYWKLLELAIRHGEPDPFHVLLFVGMRLIPHHVRRKLHHLFGRTR